jgi:hypothetical protein
MSNHVFVSHSHEDAPYADLIVKALEERGVVCWIAPRDVEAGGSYAESIITAIETACCFVLIYSKSCNFSSHVMREVERALKFGVNIVPVRFDDSTPSKSLDYLLATVHWLAIAPDGRDRSIVRAAEQILAVVAKSQHTSKPGELERSAPAIAAPVPAAPKRGPIWIVAAVLLALVAGLIGFLISKNPSSNQSVQQDSGVATTPAVSSRTSPVTAGRMDAPGHPLGITRRYFELIGNRNAGPAANLLSENFRSRLSMVKYTNNVARLPRAKLVKATIVSRNEGRVSVKAVFEDANPETHQPQWEAPIELVLEPGGWRIDSMKGLIPASGHPLPASTHSSDEEIRQ